MEKNRDRKIIKNSAVAACIVVVCIDIIAYVIAIIKYPQRLSVNDYEGLGAADIAIFIMLFIASVIIRYASYL
jgi:hypothetical protein